MTQANSEEVILRHFLFTAVHLSLQMHVLQTYKLMQTFLKTQDQQAPDGDHIPLQRRHLAINLEPFKALYRCTCM